MNEELFFEDFYKALAESVASEGYRVEKVDIPKTNTVAHGVSIIPEDGTYEFTPVLYPSNFYDAWMQGVEMSDLIEDAKQQIQHTSESLKTGIELITPEAAKDHLRTAIVSYEPNKEWLKSVPYERVEDLAVYAKWHFGNNSSATVTNGLMNRLSMTKEEVLAAAKENTEGLAKFCTLDEALKDSLRNQGISEEEIDETFKFFPETPLYVLTTEDGFDGAALLANQKVLKDIRNQLEEDFYILPSSIHEILVLPSSFVGGSIGDLQDMVKSVNETEVRLEDQLSDEVYNFDEKGLHLATAGLVLAESENMEPITHHRSR